MDERLLETLYFFMFFTLTEFLQYHSSSTTVYPASLISNEE